MKRVARSVISKRPTRMICRSPTASRASRKRGSATASESMARRRLDEGPKTQNSQALKAWLFCGTILGARTCVGCNRHPAVNYASRANIIKVRNRSRPGRGGFSRFKRFLGLDGHGAPTRANDAIRERFRRAGARRFTPGSGPAARRHDRSRIRASKESRSQRTRAPRSALSPVWR